MSTIAYLDSSAVVALLLEEPGRTEAVRRALAPHAFVATSMVAYAECRSALAAAGRSDRVARPLLATARARLDEVWFGLERVAVTEDRLRHAGALCDTRALRGFDALHLASALALGDDTTFLTWDQRLGDAARREGMTVPLE
ncbi:MAG: type II toxin-antitoxin system VapC family toxin [Candidatus Dormibacteria bacterium]